MPFFLPFLGPALLNEGFAHIEGGITVIAARQIQIGRIQAPGFMSRSGTDSTF